MENGAADNVSGPPREGQEGALESPRGENWSLLRPPPVLPPLEDKGERHVRHLISLGHPAPPPKALELRVLLFRVAADLLPADAILLSGGLASGVLMEVAAGMGGMGGKGLRMGVTVAMGHKASDRPHAAAVAARFGLHQVVAEPRAGELLEAELAFVVQALKTFDPMEVRTRGSSGGIWGLWFEV